MSGENYVDFRMGYLLDVYFKDKGASLWEKDGKMEEEWHEKFGWRKDGEIN